MAVGAALLPIGLVKDESGFTTARAITIGVGAVLVGFGIWALRTSGSIQRDGASNHFLLQ